MSDRRSRRLRPATKPARTEKGSASLATTLAHKGKTIRETHQDENTEVVPFPTGVEPARVRVSVGQTYNLGDYQSLRLDVSVELPCLPEDIQETYETASDFAVEKLNQEEAAWLGDRRR